MLSKQIYDVVVVGSGPGGVAAAIEAKKAGADDVLIIERDTELGGILLQCIHNGFGLELLKEDLPGPGYAEHFIKEMLSLHVEVLLNTMVMDITPQRHLFLSSKEHGYVEIEARAIVLAMGCRERTRAQIRIPGMRPNGIFTAGTAQRWVNVEGYMPGKEIVILGSGDIGMIMARRLTFEGAHVERVLEIQSYLSGLSRNLVQCLQDYNIPLQLNHTIKRIMGKNRVEAIEAVQVDEKWNFVPGTEEIIPCDTLLLSVGLIPENELSRKAGVKLDPITSGPYVDETFQTNVPGIFAAGNVVHVYDLVDWVSEAGFSAGKNAAKYAIALRNAEARYTPLVAGKNVRYVVPHKLDKSTLEKEDVRLQMRVTRPIEQPVWVEVHDGENLITRKAERYVRPGEMVTVVLKTKNYADVAKSSKLTIDINPR
ncbi:MAG: FAD-dependent oxidoreductase [Chloroflexi bacterium]|jgi:thioredoxin reductase|nr:FAD-dependent oxidoreductase [Anaerolineaceae bacterium]NLI45151.1 FAD-dependent oxidoreductase [Chloroflexota bacterium]HOE35410.1 FAD-dependent oxidoreductase [Anaerolineaceae bacterium]HOT26499.1 FAD-dependent oxidoreductase [Anaerolineaceae bacterium]HQH57837.1 FAD-dependent oxidoreductase [Anaerolineaceae bacterium]